MRKPIMRHLISHARNGVIGLGILVCAAMAWALVREPDLSQLSAMAVDRLRMHADDGQDAAALQSLLLAARQGNVEAMQAGASVLLHHPALDEAARGLPLAHAAAQQNNRSAQYLLGKAYFDGAPTRPPDLAQARNWFEKAAAQQHPKAAYLLGLMFKNGYGTAADPVAAAAWFEQAVELGNADAMFMLANAYFAGEGVDRNPREALRLYMKAAALEHPLAAQTIAYAFKDGGLGLPQSERQSQQLMLGVAHSLRHPRAAY